jgi:RNA polymerase sigma-70 factor (ECF subfamily)
MINKLPDDYRVVILMRLAGFKYQEIADKLGISISLVKSRIFYGKKRLKYMLCDFK